MSPVNIVFDLVAVPAAVTLLVVVILDAWRVR